MRNIYFVGFMGAGKTTIAKELGKTLNDEHLDLDDYIEQKIGCSIAEIFLKKGEEFFRKIEYEALQEINNLTQKIVATGGGIVQRPANREILKNEYVIWLDVPFETLYKRISGDASRPLAKSYTQLEQLYKRRLEMYEDVATKRIECGEMKIGEVLEVIQEIVEEWQEETSNY